MNNTTNNSNNNFQSSQNYNTNGYQNNAYQNNAYQNNAYQNNAYSNQVNSQQMNNTAYPNYDDFNPVYMSVPQEHLHDISDRVVAKSFVVMFLVLLISGISAITAYDSGFFWDMVFDNSLFYGLIIAELVIVFTASFLMKRDYVLVSAVMLLAYSIVNGITMSFIFFLYDLESIKFIFFVTAVLFGILSIFGLTTKRNMSTIGFYCYMGLIAIIGATVVNIFLNSGTLDFICTIVAIVLFVGITAYDVQRIKSMVDSKSQQSEAALAMFGALQLYLDFINIFLRLLMLFGKRK